MNIHIVFEKGVKYMFRDMECLTSIQPVKFEPHCQMLLIAVQCV